MAPTKRACHTALMDDQCCFPLVLLLKDMRRPGGGGGGGGGVSKYFIDCIKDVIIDEIELLVITLTYAH